MLISFLPYSVSCLHERKTEQKKQRRTEPTWIKRQLECFVVQPGETIIFITRVQISIQNVLRGGGRVVESDNYWRGGEKNESNQKDWGHCSVLGLYILQYIYHSEHGHGVWSVSYQTPRLVCHICTYVAAQYICLEQSEDQELVDNLIYPVGRFVFADFM